MRLALAFIVGPCDVYGGPAAFSHAVEGAVFSSVSAGNWTTEFVWSGDKLKIARAMNGTVLRRALNDVDVAMPDYELVVNGSRLNFLPNIQLT